MIHQVENIRRNPNRKLVVRVIRKIVILSHHLLRNHVVLMIDVKQANLHQTKSNDAFFDCFIAFILHLLEVRHIDVDKKKVTIKSTIGKKNFRLSFQGLENVTDSEEHHDEPVLPKQSKSRR